MFFFVVHAVFYNPQSVLFQHNPILRNFIKTIRRFVLKPKTRCRFLHVFQLYYSLYGCILLLQLTYNI